ncbi:MAG: hypothetical protein MJB14_18285 [Spirochaetes bacterium]|nr:hypothetical protein [Spirochaetota bacterium]
MIVFDLDIKTLSFFTGIISLILGFCLVYFLNNRKKYPGFILWILAISSNGTGSFLLAFRATLPDFLTIVIANTCFILFYFFVFTGIDQFTNNFNIKRTILSVIIVVIMLIFFILFTYSYPNINMRIIVYSLTASVLVLIYFFSSVGFLKELYPDKTGILTLSLLCNFALFFVRIFYTLFFESKITNFLESGMIHQLSFIVTVIINITIMITLVIINSERLRNELTAANKKIEDLANLLPICSNCKKIKDDQGYWKDVEEYIEKKTDVTLSHSLCNDCMTKIYGKEDWFNRKKALEKD